MRKKVQVVVIAKEGNELFLLRLKTNEKRGRFWQNITGSVEEGEEIAAAALREFQEETGLNASSAKFTDVQYKFSFRMRDGRPAEEFTFLCVLNGRQNVILDPKEHESYEWKPLAQVASFDFYYASSFEAFKKAKIYV